MQQFRGPTNVRMLHAQEWDNPKLHHIITIYGPIYGTNTVLEPQQKKHTQQHGALLFGLLEAPMGVIQTD